LRKLLDETTAALLARDAAARGMWLAAEGKIVQLVTSRRMSAGEILRIYEGCWTVAAASAAGPRVSSDELEDQIAAMQSYTVAERERIARELCQALPDKARSRFAADFQASLPKPGAD
jgi:hypothetical protein